MDTALYLEALDETGTVSTAALNESTIDTESTTLGTTAEAEEEEGKVKIAEELLRVHGIAPGKKPEGITRIIYENVNGLNTRISGNEKVEKAKDVIDELEADVVCYNEHRINIKHKQNHNGFNQLFRGGEADIRSVVAHNVHENVSRVQEGGTSMILFGSLIQQFDFEHSGKDDTGLGRWCYMTFCGSEGINTRIVCGYNPCYNNKKESNTSYQQHRRFFITKQKDKTCPRKRFREDLVSQLKNWRANGDRLIVCLDTNEDIYNKSIGRILTEREGLAMSEVVGDFTCQKVGATYFRGTTPIDGVWATSDVTVVGACVMPVGYGVGDHRLFIVDFLKSCLVGACPPHIIRAAARRLNSRIPNVAEKYSEIFEQLVIEHKLIERLGEAHESSSVAQIVNENIDKIDKESKQYMAHAENKCRKIKSGKIPFSPESTLWIKRRQTYRSLMRYHAGNKVNKGNLKRAARRVGIRTPMQLSIQEIRDRLKVCRAKCKYYKKYGKRYRRKHLINCLNRAKKNHNEEAEKKILAIIQREKDRSFWSRHNYSMGKKQGGSVRSVQIERGQGEIEEATTQQTVHEAIWNEIHRKRFYLAEQAPICKGTLRGDFGYTAFSPTARKILAGRYDYPEGFDPATRELLEECARIRQTVPKRSVATIIRRQEWEQRWKRAKEDTSSSMSGLHFGHYKAGAQSQIISHFHALKTSLLLHRGIALDRWSHGLSVMLEKMFGCSLVTKLRSILLMEADFNFANKTIYGGRMLENVRKHNLMPEEIFSERNRMADDGTLAKVLFYDIVRQLRVSAGISSVDAANCYDSIAHAIASLVFQAFGVPEEAIAAMLTAIEEMKYFLRTAYGDSKEYVGSTIEVKFQGLCQGNGAAPAGWAVISITIINAHKRKGHGGHFLCPISRREGHLAAILFVDDTDLIHIDMEQDQSVYQAHAAMQESIENWGQLLIATGGSLKPSKCFYHMISFVWSPDGRWKYENNEDDEDLNISVPMPDGSSVFIDHEAVGTSKKTLGVETCPSGDNKGQLEAMQDKAQGWVDKAKNGKLQRRSLWFLLDKQFWPKVKYGLCGNTAGFLQLEDCLQKQYWQIMPIGGIIRSAPRAIRQVDRGFYGVGFPHLGVESLVEQLNKLLMHYGCRTSVGLKMQLSLELLTLEMGISNQPLQESYKRYSSWITAGWFKSVWEKIDMFGITVEVHNIPLLQPRSRDRWMMLEFMRLGYSPHNLRILNKIRVHQQVVYLSDVLGASGKSLDRKYLKQREIGEQWSTYRFPKEKPPSKDFRLWQQAITQLIPAGGIMDRLGSFKVPGHKIWEWRLDENKTRLLQIKGKVMDIYEPSRVRGYTHTPNRWTRVQIDMPAISIGQYCTIREVAPAVVAVLSQTDPPPPPLRHDSFLEVLVKWGCTWMWDSMVLIGDDDWIEKAIANRSCVAVTDGSYMRELYPHVCSAAFIFECTKGTGRLIGSFPEQSVSANAYRGELLGLMAIHLILRGVNEIAPALGGSVTVISDCLGAISRVEHLPPHRIPSKCKHSDILKNILVSCSDLSFELVFEHVNAHQDDRETYDSLTRKVQLNCLMDGKAKQELWNLDPDNLPNQKSFPLEKLCVFLGNEKMSSDTGARIRFWAHKQLSEQVYWKLRILLPDQFKEVDWEMVHTALHALPRMFQIWACKQVMGVAGTNLFQSKYRPKHDPMCPSCTRSVESCSHVLHCPEEGRVDTLLGTIDFLNSWMKKIGTDTELRNCLVRYAKGRGAITLTEIVGNRNHRLYPLAQSQDCIGWRRFMEGMISKEITSIQKSYLALSSYHLSIERWTTGLITKLLEVTHGQWLYRNIHVHDSISGSAATLQKEEIQMEIEKQQELGSDTLEEGDKYLMEINLEDMENTSGERQQYWLLAIRAAREASTLRARNRTRTSARTAQRRAINSSTSQ